LDGYLNIHKAENDNRFIRTPFIQAYRLSNPFYGLNIAGNWSRTTRIRNLAPLYPKAKFLSLKSVLENNKIPF